MEDVGGNCGSESATLEQRILSTEQHRTILRSLPWIEGEDMKLIHGRKRRCLEVARRSNLLDAILAHLGPFAQIAPTIEHLPSKKIYASSVS